MTDLPRKFSPLIVRPRRGHEGVGPCAALAAALLGLLLLLGCAAAPDAAPAPARGSVSAERAGPLLWRASRAGAGDVFLFGSVHMGTDGARAFGPAVEEAWAVSDELVVEVDLTDIPPEEIAARNATYALLPPGRTLADVVSAETYRLLSDRMAERGTPMIGLVGMQPWAVASLLAVLEFQAAGYDVEHGVDRQIMAEARGRLPIRGLETIDSQLAMLSGLPPHIQELMLLDMLERTEEVQAEVVDLMDAWRRGDEEQLTRLLFEPLEQQPEFAEFYETVFFGRNEAMAAQLAQLSRDGRRRFVVLGAGHMVGPRGIPALLAARGFDVEQQQPR